MQPKFRIHEKIKLLINPKGMYIEYMDSGEVPIKKGMTGEVNKILVNGDYHVKIINDVGVILAYLAVKEKDLEKI